MASGFRPAFRNYFLTAQLAAGLAMAVKAFIVGVRESGVGYAFLWALGGFLFVLPVAALIALPLAYADAKGLLLDRRVNWLRAIALSVLVTATFFAALIGFGWASDR